MGKAVEVAEVGNKARNNFVFFVTTARFSCIIVIRKEYTMALTVDQLRNFDSNWGNLVVQQDSSTASTKVKAGGLRHAIASLFHTDAAQARNRATYTAIYNAIMQDDRFFDPDVQAKASELLGGLQCESGIKASTIKDIIRQLDEMSTPDKQIATLKKAAKGHLAASGVPDAIPRNMHAKYEELAADFVAFRSDTKTSFASINVGQRLTEFNQLMTRIFNLYRGIPVATDAFCKALEKYTPGGDSISLRPEDKIQGFADRVRENLQELDEIANSRGRAIGNSLAVLMQRTGVLRPDVMTEIVDKGATLPKCGLDELNGQSGASAIHSAVSKMADAVEKARSELGHSVTEGIDPDELGAALAKSAMVRLPQDARRNLLAALKSNGGKNLLGYYAQNSANPKAQAMNLVYSALLVHLRAEFDGKAPGASVRAPDVATDRLPPNALCAFTLDGVFAGGLAREVKDFALNGSGIDTASDPAAALRNKMDGIAKAKVFMQMVTGMASLSETSPDGTKVFDPGRPERDFDRDVNRDGHKPGFMTIRLPDGTAISAESSEEGRDALVKLVTGNPNARFRDLDKGNPQQAKIMTKVQLLMCLLHQGTADTATRSVGIAFRPEQQMPRVVFPQGGGGRTQNYVVSRDDNGAVKISFNMRFTSPMVVMNDDITPPTHKQTNATSTADFSLEITIPEDNLDALGGADWAAFDSTNDLVAKENGANPTRFETLQTGVPQEFQFRGDVSVSFSVNASKA